MTNLIDLVLAAKARFVAIQAELNGTFSPQEHMSDDHVTHVEKAWRLARRAEVEIGEGMKEVEQKLVEFASLREESEKLQADHQKIQVGGSLQLSGTQVTRMPANASVSGKSQDDDGTTRRRTPLSANQSEGAFFQVIVSADEDADITREEHDEIAGTYDFKLKWDCPDMTVGQIASAILESFHESTGIRNDTLDIMVVDRDGNEIEAQSADRIPPADLQRLVCYFGKSSGFDDKPSGMRPSN